MESGEGVSVVSGESVVNVVNGGEVEGNRRK